MSFQTVGCLLCGGSSRRMGTDKFTLTHNGKTWIEILSEKMAPICDTLVYSFRDSTQLEGLKNEPRHTILYDEIPGAGPLGAWLSCIRRFPDCRLISVPVDMPLLETSDLRNLAQLEASGYIVSGNDHHFLLSHLEKCDFERLQDVFSVGVRRVEEFWESISAKQLQYPADPRFRNFNRPEDLDDCHEDGDNQLKTQV